jgi:integrase
MLRDYVLLLLFTGMRRREAAALRWNEVDFAGA